MSEFNYTDASNYFNTSKGIFRLNGKEYKVSKSFKHTIFLNQRRLELKKAEQEAEKNGEVFDTIGANFKLIEDVLKLSVGEEFVEDIDKMDLSDEDYMKLFNIINYMRGGKTQEEAYAQVLKDREEEEKEESEGEA